MAPLRLRRMRVIVAIAVLIVLGLYNLMNFSSSRSAIAAKLGGFPVGKSNSNAAIANLVGEPKAGTQKAGGVGAQQQQKGAQGASPPLPPPAPVAGGKTPPDGSEAATEQASEPGQVQKNARPQVQLPIVFKPSKFDWREVPEFYPIPSSATMVQADAAGQREHTNAAAQVVATATPILGPLIPLPHGAKTLPRVQYDFGSSKGQLDAKTRMRRGAVRNEFLRGWRSYRKLAWQADELQPVSGIPRTTFGGWSATLVDALDTLYIMGLDEEFREAAAAAAAMDLRFTTNTTAALEAEANHEPPLPLSVNMFETTIRHLGGLLSAFDLSGEIALRQKAEELGNLLMRAFDTPNRMPGFWLDFARAQKGQQEPGTREPSASMASLALEFTRLAQLTGEDRYYDAVARVRDYLRSCQHKTVLAGMWPTHLNWRDPLGNADADLGNKDFAHGRPENTYSIGAEADSLYEYLLKEHLLLGGADDTWLTMYRDAAATITENLLFRPMVPPIDASSPSSLSQMSLTPARRLLSSFAKLPSIKIVADEYPDLLVPGVAYVQHRTSSGATSTPPDVQLGADLQHLTCFAGGMFALGARILDRPDHLDIGASITRACVWAYATTPSGIMPEIVELFACKPDKDKHKNKESDKDHSLTFIPCAWSQEVWDQHQRKLQQEADEDGEEDAVKGAPEPLAGKSPRRFPLPRGFAAAKDRRYILRPEAIESVFVLYRITGDERLRDVAWDMFEAIRSSTATKLANAAIEDVLLWPKGQIRLADSMESFWFAETLKYFYLIFSPPDQISLDEYVFNTEAHPLKRPKPGA